MLSLGLPLTLALILTVPEATPSLEERAQHEVERLHVFFEEWFRGSLPRETSEFSTFADTLAEGFVIVSPSGRLTPREPLLQGLEGAHGRWREDPGARIWIKNVQVRHQVGQLLVVTYEEWQHQLDETRGRLSTALLEARGDGPNGLTWLHVHETWLPSDPAAE